MPSTFQARTLDRRIAICYMMYNILLNTVMRIYLLLNWQVMSARRIRVLIASVVVLVGLGGVLLYAPGRGALVGTLVAAIAVIGVLWVIVTEVGRGNWQFLEWLNPLECCSFFAVFGITS